MGLPKINILIFLYFTFYNIQTRGVIMWSSMFLAISSSIDALGIGITYGIKNTKIPLIEKFILFVFLLLSIFRKWIILIPRATYSSTA